VWTHSGCRIVFTTMKYSRVFTGDPRTPELVVAEYLMIKPRCVSVSSNTVVLADWDRGIYESNNDGMSWIELPLRSGWKRLQAINVSRDELWVLEMNETDSGWHLNKYVGNLSKCDEVELSDVQLGDGSRLAYYSTYKTMLLLDYHNKTVFALSTNKPYDPVRLLSAGDFTDGDRPLSISVSSEGLLYVGQKLGKIGEFALNYK